MTRKKAKPARFFNIAEQVNTAAEKPWSVWETVLGVRDGEFFMSQVRVAGPFDVREGAVEWLSKNA